MLSCFDTSRYARPLSIVAYWFYVVQFVGENLTRSGRQCCLQLGVVWYVSENGCDGLCSCFLLMLKREHAWQNIRHVV